MAKWYKNLYVGKTVVGKEKKVIRQINRGRFLPGLYLITYAANEIDQLDILNSKYLLQKKVRESLPCIVGIAFGYQEALDLITEMATETYDSTGTCNIRSYLQSMQQ